MTPNIKETNIIFIPAARSAQGNKKRSNENHEE